MKKSEMIIVTDSDFYHRITKKYQKGRRSPLRFPLMIFLDKMRNFLSQGMNIDVLLRFYLTRQYQKFSMFLNSFQTIQKLFRDISIVFHAPSSPLEKIFRSAISKSLYTGDIAVFLNKLLRPIFSVPINKQVSSQILYYGNNVEFFNPAAGEITNNIKSVFAKYLTQNKNISIFSSLFWQESPMILSRILRSRMIQTDVIFPQGKTDERSSSGRSHINYLQILSPAFIILKSKISSDRPEEGFVYDFSFHSIYEQKSPTILMRWHNGMPTNAYNQTGVFDVHYPDIKLSDSSIKNLQIPQSIIIKSNTDQKIDYSFIQREKIRNYLSTFIQTSPEIISELKGEKLFAEAHVRSSFSNGRFQYGKISQMFGKYFPNILKDKLQQYRSVSEHKLILMNIPASNYHQSIYDLSSQVIQLSRSNEFFNKIYQNSTTFAVPLIKNSMKKGSEVPFLPLPQKELITKSDNLYFQNVPNIENAIEKFEKMASEIKETVTRSLPVRGPEVQHQIELHHLSDKVYQMIDRRLKIEKERRGYL